MPSPIIVSYSELDAYRQCPLKWHLKYVERWVPPEVGPALSKGSLWHTAMEAHYLALKEVQDDKMADSKRLKLAAEAVGRALQPLNDSEHLDLILWMYEGYVANYGWDPQWRILAVEVTDVMPLPPLPGRKTSKFHLKTKIDLIVRELTLPSTPIVLVDHKSGQNLPSEKELDIDDQFGLYEWQMRSQGYKIFGTLHNAARTTRNQADFPGYVGKSQPQTFDKRMMRTKMSRATVELNAIAQDAVATANAAYQARNLRGEVHSSPNPDTCRWRCDLLQPHLAARKSGTPIQTVLRGTGWEQNYTRH